MRTPTDTRSRLTNEVAASGKSFRLWYNDTYLNSTHWRQLRELKFAISGRRCQQCSSESSLHVHHLNYKSIYDVTPLDLLVVCKPCHDNLHAHRHTSPKSAKPPKIKRVKIRNKKKKGNATAVEVNGKKSEVHLPTSASRPPRVRFMVDRPKVEPFATDGRIAVVTKEMIISIKTRAGAWTARQCECLGLDFLPPKGWLKNWKPKEIPLNLWEEAEAITRLPPCHPQPNS
jgi:hypothetical protein